MLPYTPLIRNTFCRRVSGAVECAKLGLYAWCNHRPAGSLARRTPSKFGACLAINNNVVHTSRNVYINSIYVGVHYEYRLMAIEWQVVRLCMLGQTRLGWLALRVIPRHISRQIRATGIYRVGQAGRMTSSMPRLIGARLAESAWLVCAHPVPRTDKRHAHQARTHATQISEPT